MPAATNKSDLLKHTRNEFAKLRKVLDGIQAGPATQKDDDDTSVKDVIGHRAHWIELFLGWYADGQAGKEVFFPAEGFKWNELPAYNAQLRKNQKRLSWKAAQALLDDNHQRLLDFIEASPDRKLYGGPMKGARNAWTPGRWAEAAGASHYRSAAKYVRKRLRAG